MESKAPSSIDLNTELAKLTMFRGRTPQSTMADRKGSGARLAAYRDGGLFAPKFAGKGHWESYLAGDELIHILDGTATLEIVCDDGPPKSFALRAAGTTTVQMSPSTRADFRLGVPTVWFWRSTGITPPQSIIAREAIGGREFGV